MSLTNWLALIFLAFLAVAALGAIVMWGIAYLVARQERAEEDAWHQASHSHDPRQAKILNIHESGVPHE